VKIYEGLLIQGLLGVTPLQIAAKNGHVETCKLLRDRDIARREEKAAKKARMEAASAEDARASPEPGNLSTPPQEHEDVAAKACSPAEDSGNSRTPPQELLSIPLREIM
jgi:ankyrin repeat protein